MILPLTVIGNKREDKFGMKDNEFSFRYTDDWETITNSNWELS